MQGAGPTTKSFEVRGCHQLSCPCDQIQFFQFVLTHRIGIGYSFGCPSFFLESIALEARSRELLHALDRLGNIARHEALVLLRYSLGSSKLLHILRCSPCAGHPGLQRFDSALRDGLGKVLNLSLSDDQWLQASLPIKAGGLGIRLATSLALPAFLASAAGTLS